MFTDHGPGHSSMSWWPTDNLWQYCAQHTRWTEKVENWYSSRLQQIREGKARPLNAREWKTQICGSSALRRIDKLVTKASDRFVDAHVKA